MRRRSSTTIGDKIMATRSLIAMTKDDKSIQVIYCHWDGYPEYVGLQLQLNYRDKETIQKLLDLGDRSTLDGTPTPENTYAVKQNQEIKPWIVASMDEFMSMDKAGADYVYLWDGSWQIHKADYDNNLTSLGTMDSVKLVYAEQVQL
jgi:hypothetical protein